MRERGASALCQHKIATSFSSLFFVGSQLQEYATRNGMTCDEAEKSEKAVSYQETRRQDPPGWMIAMGL